MRIAAIFLRCKALYLHAQSQTTEGAWIAAPPFIKFGWDDRDLAAKLGRIVPQVLSESRQGVPHPTKWNLAEPLYQLAGVKSWRQFVAGGCQRVRIEDRDGAVYLVPQENRGAKGGFVDCAEPILCSQTELSDWRMLLTKAFGFCK